MDDSVELIEGAGRFYSCTRMPVFALVLASSVHNE